MYSVISSNGQEIHSLPVVFPPTEQKKAQNFKSQKNPRPISPISCESSCTLLHRRDKNRSRHETEKDLYRSDSCSVSTYNTGSCVKGQYSDRGRGGIKNSAPRNVRRPMISTAESYDSCVFCKRCFSQPPELEKHNIEVYPYQRHEEEISANLKSPALSCSGNGNPQRTAKVRQTEHGQPQPNCQHVAEPQCQLKIGQQDGDVECQRKPVVVQDPRCYQEHECQRPYSHPVFDQQRLSAESKDRTCNANHTVYRNRTKKSVVSYPTRYAESNYSNVISLCAPAARYKGFGSENTKVCNINVTLQCPSTHPAKGTLTHGEILRSPAVEVKLETDSCIETPPRSLKHNEISVCESCRFCGGDGKRSEAKVFKNNAFGDHTSTTPKDVLLQSLDRKSSMADNYIDSASRYEMSCPNPHCTTLFVDNIKHERSYGHKGDHKSSPEEDEIFPTTFPSNETVIESTHGMNTRTKEPDDRRTVKQELINGFLQHSKKYFGSNGETSTQPAEQDVNEGEMKTVLPTQFPESIKSEAKSEQWSNHRCCCNCGTDLELSLVNQQVVVGQLQLHQDQSASGIKDEETCFKYQNVNKNQGVPLADASILMIGGTHFDIPSRPMTGTSVLKFDAGKDTWTCIGQLPHGRSFHSSFLLNGLIYVAGGYVSSLSGARWICGSTLRLQIPEMKQNSGQKLNWEKMADMNLPRACHACACLMGKAYVIGGRDADGRITSHVERYDPEINVWQVVTSHPVPLVGLSAVSVSGAIFTFGGVTEYRSEEGCETNCTDFVFRFDPICLRWTACPRLPAPRSYLSASPDDSGKVWVVGGTTWLGTAVECGPDGDHGKDSAVWLYDADTGHTWKTLPLPFPRHSAAVCRIGSKLVVTGGLSYGPGQHNSKEKILQDTLVLDCRNTGLGFRSMSSMPSPVLGATLLHMPDFEEQIVPGFG